MAGDRDLVAVLARVAGAGDQHVDAKARGRPAVHEHLAGALGDVGGQHLHGLRSLQRQQRAVLQALDADLRGQLVVDDAEVVVLAGPVDDDEQAVAVRTRGHQVVDDAALLVEQHTVALLAGRQADEVAGGDLLEGRQRGDAAQPGLAHVRHVEQARVLAGPQVLLQHPVPVLHGHRVARERDHARADGDMRVKERGLLQIVLRHAGLRRGRCGSPGLMTWRFAPAVLEPERFQTVRTVLAPSAHRGCGAFQRS